MGLDAMAKERSCEGGRETELQAARNRIADLCGVGKAWDKDFFARAQAKKLQQQEIARRNAAESKQKRARGEEMKKNHIESCAERG
jgi:hypothetical protein